MREEREQQSDLKKADTVPQGPLLEGAIKRATDWVSEPRKSLQRAWSCPGNRAPEEATGVYIPRKAP